MMKTKTLKVRVKDKHAHLLNQQAKVVNFVWNFINDLSFRSIRQRGRFLSSFDIDKYTAGSSKEISLHSQCFQEISKEYVTRRNQFKKSKLNWRKSGGAKRSLGWIPFKTGAAKFKNGQVFHNGNHFKIWDSYGLSQYKFKSGSFNEDALGRWYFNVVVEIKAVESTGKSSVGIDLGCKTSATDSNGFEIVGREYRRLEEKLGISQRANNKKRTKAIHAKIKNRRQDTQHKYSRKLVNENAAIFVGNVSSLGLAKTKMAKSVLDAGWGQFRAMLEYKCDHAGVVFEVVNEAYTTQTCSSCGSRQNSPKGRAGLGIREWKCECGVTHDRDINAAKNILAVGLDRLVGEKVAA
jgi:putative transposase